MRKRRLVRTRLWLGLALVLAAAGGYAWLVKSRQPNVRLTISCPQREFKLGDEVPVTFTLKNEGRLAFPAGSDSWLERIPFLGHLFVTEVPYLELGVMVRRDGGTICTHAWGDWRIDQSSMEELEPGQSLSETFTLNDRVLIGEPGTYKVVGLVMAGLGINEGLASELRDGHLSFFKVVLRSSPFEIVIDPRTSDEMGQHISAVKKAFLSAKTDSERYAAIKKLAYTRDNRALPQLLEFEYLQDEENYYGVVYDALMRYLPIEAEAKEMIVSVAGERGLTNTTLRALLRQGYSKKGFEKMIALSLASRNPRYVISGANAAQAVPSDVHMAKLIEIAKDASSPAREEAILALAANRTEAGVSMLNALSNDSNEDLRLTARIAICIGCKREPTVALDVGSLDKVVGVAKDANEPGRWDAVTMLVYSLDYKDLTAARQLADNPNERGPFDEANPRLKVIQDLLRDPDRDVRDMMTTIVRLVSVTAMGWEGRPLKPEDFPEMIEW